MAECTPARVEERLRKAVALKARLSHSVTKLEPTSEGIGIIGGIGVELRASVGEDDVVVEAVEALSWPRWLEADDVDIVLARIERAPWKLICWRYGISRPTADRRFRYALAVIAWRHNGNVGSRRTPSLRSMLGLPRAA